MPLIRSLQKRQNTAFEGWPSTVNDEDAPLVVDIGRTAPGQRPGKWAFQPLLALAAEAPRPQGYRFH